MESCVKDMLERKGYAVNDNAQSIIKAADGWYRNSELAFHKRTTAQGKHFTMRRLGFAKRCCSDDANLCEVIEINAGGDTKEIEEQAAARKTQDETVNQILRANRFNTQYRRQLEQTSAHGTVACYVRMDDVKFMDDNSVKDGKIRLNYVTADCFIPLTTDNDVVTEAAFSGSILHNGEKITTLVMFTLDGTGRYIAETHTFDKSGNELKDREQVVQLGDVKPFGVMKIAEVNNLEDMEGYGYPKIYGAIPILETLDLCFNVLFGDLDKADKLILINEALCKFDENGKPITPSEQMKKIFIMLGQRLPEDKALVQEYNPKIRIEEITKTFELALSLLSMMFGYGTKKYSFENGQIITASQYIGERQDQMQELNRQRQEAKEYISDICKAIMWFSNTYHGTAFDLDTEVLIDFDDSFISDKETQIQRRRDDAATFDIPELLIWYLMEAYNLSEDEAKALVERQQDTKEQDADGEEED
ncbi:MAG: phage portal protein [Lachnospiraceae bacterium]|nr:phage portal protein [Lachnospiraceae bacterium]